jgi:DNA-binding response OmpR family regulator
MNVPAPPRTLVIDDDPVMRRVLCNYLLRLGHEFLEAKDGREGLGLFRSDHPDLVLVDLLMPVMDGMEFLGIATRENPAIPVIVVSGAGGIDDVIRALRIGAWDYVTKPITDLSVLEHTINMSLERARLLKENSRYQEFLEGEVKRRTLELELINQELERTQQQLWEQLEQAQKMESVGMLAGGIAHDFNNILASIFFSAEMVMESLPRDQPEYADLERIIRVSRRGKSLVRRILSFTSTRSKLPHPLSGGCRGRGERPVPAGRPAVEYRVECRHQPRIRNNRRRSGPDPADRHESDHQCRACPQRDAKPKAERPCRPPP